MRIILFSSLGAANVTFAFIHGVSFGFAGLDIINLLVGAGMYTLAYYYLKQHQ
jgi:hypothetical protein